MRLRTDAPPRLAATELELNGALRRRSGGENQMRRTRRALVGDAGDIGGPGGDAPRPDGVTTNDATCDTVGVALIDFASIRSAPSPATNVAWPSGQQLVEVTLGRASDASCDDAPVVPVAPDSVDAAER